MPGGLIQLHPPPDWSPRHVGNRFGTAGGRCDHIYDVCYSIGRILCRREILVGAPLIYWSICGARCRAIFALHGQLPAVQHTRNHAVDTTTISICSFLFPYHGIFPRFHSEYLACLRLVGFHHSTTAPVRVSMPTKPSHITEFSVKPPCDKKYYRAIAEVGASAYTNREPLPVTRHTFN